MIHRIILRISSMEESMMNMITFQPLAFSIPFILFLFLLFKRPFGNGKNLPPSPPQLPIIGNLHQIGTSPHRSLQALSRKYGEIMFLRLGSKPTLVVSSKEMASQILKTHESCFSERTKLAIAKSAFYNCKEIFFSPYGEQWRSLRSLCMLKLFSSKRVKSFRRVREEEVTAMIAKIKESSVVNLSELIFTLTNNLICRAAFGRTYGGGKGGSAAEFEKLIGGVIGVVGSNNVEDVLPWMGWINRFNGVNAKINRISKGFEDVVGLIIEEQASRMKEGSDKDSDADETSLQNFVDILLEVQRNNSTNGVALDNKAIEGVIFDMFAAGTHTNHVTLEWTFTELLRHPRIMKRLQEEVRGIAGSKERVWEEDVEKMVYLKAVIKESFRFHPPVPLPIPRECTEEVKIKGYDIAVGTQVIVNVWAIARDPAYWEKPDEFVPERFLDSQIDFRGQHFELIPFGGGRRGCPAISFAIAGIELALANLVHRFDWSLPHGANNESIDVSESVGSISHKRNPLIVVPTPWLMN